MLFLGSIEIDDITEHQKLETLYNLYKKRMWYVANTVLNDSQEAEDAVHNAFIGIARNINHIGEIESHNTLAYVITAAKHSALNIAERQHHKDTYNFESFFNIADVKTSYHKEQFEEKSVVLSVLKKMPEAYRDILYLHYYRELNEKEIADLLDKNYATVRKQVSRAKKMFAELFEKEDEEYEEQYWLSDQMVDNVQRNHGCHTTGNCQRLVARLLQCHHSTGNQGVGYRCAERCTQTVYIQYFPHLLGMVDQIQCCRFQSGKTHIIRILTEF